MLAHPDFLHPDRLFPADPTERRAAREVYEALRDLPIISPHGHTDPAWFATNAPFRNAAEILLIPDHYVLRLLFSQGLSYDDLGVPRRDGAAVAEPRDAWRRFAAHYHLFDGTPSGLWTDHALHWAFGITERLNADNADRIYDLINERLAEPDLRPRALLDAARVEVIATTETALDDLSHHAALASDGMGGRIRTTYRPDDVTDPDTPDFAHNLARLSALTNHDTSSWSGLIEAHRVRRAAFREMGAVATDHAMPETNTANLPHYEKESLLARLLSGRAKPGDAALFRAQMLTEMAALSAEDGMVMQLHAGARRNTDPVLMAERGPNMGADMPSALSPVRGLETLLHAHGRDPNFRLIYFCLDETTLSRELAPMAGYWPSLILGPPWWFHDSPRGIARYLDAVVETAGFMNLAGFNDDSRALLSIPARHDVWRRSVAAFLGRMVATHQISAPRAREIAAWLCHGAARAAYRLDDA